MKILAAAAVILLLLISFSYAQQQRSDSQGGRPDPNSPPSDPFMQLFDTNEDGEISKSEIENAVSILKGLDRDGSGSLTRDELPRPPRPEGGVRRLPASLFEPNQSLRNLPTGTVVFSGGDETNPVDRGRPVALIAAALGVSAEVFRDAFSRVRPAQNGRPTAARERQNKQVLMAALAKHGITNKRLDQVSNYYRPRIKGTPWRPSPTAATAIIKNGKVTGFKIVDAGSGYLTAPNVTVVGFPDLKVEVKIEASTDFAKNGRVAEIKIVE